MKTSNTETAAGAANTSDGKAGKALHGTIPTSKITWSPSGVNGEGSGKNRMSNRIETLRDAAIKYALHGFRVFPCKVEGKEPAGKLVPHGCLDATTDSETIKEWWSCKPYNIGIATGTGLVILDEDEHPERGKDGAAALTALEQMHSPLPETVTALTGGGGKHRFFRCDDSRITIGKDVDVRTRKDDPRILPEGLDYRGNGGYVVAAPSAHPGTGALYEWEPGHAPGEIEIAQLPEWMQGILLADKVRSAGEYGSANKGATDKTSLGIVLEQIPEGGRNDFLFRRASGLRNQGFSYDEILALILVMNKQRCCPPLDGAEVKTICWSACKYDPDPLGGLGMERRRDVRKVDNAFAAFGFYSVPDLTEEERRPPEFIIDDMIPVGLTFLSGAPKTRKSFLALQMAIAVAQGKPFFDRETKACDVAYLDLEGSKSRISARTAGMVEKVPRNLFVTNSTDVKLADGLVNMLRQLHQQRPSIRFMIIDTYSRARGMVKAAGQNAYDADVMLLEPLQRMALEEGVAVLCVHHNKKGAALMADSFEMLSGTMGISGSADCVCTLITEGKRFDGKAKLECTPRDAKSFEQDIMFDNVLMEWMPRGKPELERDPVCAWAIAKVPERGACGTFFPYEECYHEVYNRYSEDSGVKIREVLKAHQDELYMEHGVGVQLGVKSNGRRGIRLFNMK